MRKSLIICVLSLFLLRIQSVHGQSSANRLKENSQYSGAKAAEKLYKVIYQLDSNEPKIIEKTIRNINNALSDPRLKGKLKVELIAFSGGTDAYLKSGPYEQAIKTLVQNGVLVAQCANSLKERGISRDKLFDFVAIVPSGNGELIIRQADGWTIIKP